MAFLTTSADLIQRTYRLLHDVSASPTYWPSAQVVGYLDEAQAAVGADLNLLHAEWAVTTSAAVSVYTLPSTVLKPRHVLWASAGASARALAFGATVDAFTYTVWAASGTPQMWVPAGMSAGPQIRLLPSPDHSAASGLVVLGNPIPTTIATAAPVLPSMVLPMVCIQAALFAWEERGQQPEVDRLTKLYQARAGLWRRTLTDLSPEETDIVTLGPHGSPYPYSTAGRTGYGFMIR